MQCRTFIILVYPLPINSEHTHTQNYNTISTIISAIKEIQVMQYVLQLRHPKFHCKLYSKEPTTFCFLESFGVHLTKMVTWVGHSEIDEEKMLGKEHLGISPYHPA